MGNSRLGIALSRPFLLSVAAILCASLFADVQGVVAAPPQQPPAKTQFQSDEAARLGMDKLFGSTRLREFRGQPMFTPDGKYLVGNNSWNFKFLEVETGQTHEVPMKSRTGMQGLGGSLLSPDGTKLLLDGINGVVSVWNVTTGEPVFVKPSNHQYTRAKAWSPDGAKVITGHGNGIAQVWNAQTGEEIASFQLGITGPVDAAACSSDGTLYACVGSDPETPVAIIDANTKLEIQRINAQLQRHQGIAGIAFLSEDELLFCGTRRTEINGEAQESVEIKIWNPKTGELIREFPQARDMGEVDSMCLTPDRTQVVVKADDLVRFFDVQSGEIIRELARLPVSPIGGDIAISPDGKKIAYGGVLVKLIEVESGAWLYATPSDGHDSSCSYSQSPDGKLLVSSGNDGRVIVWDWETCQVLHTFEFDRELESAGFHWAPDGKLFYLVRHSSFQSRRRGNSTSVVMAFDPVAKVKVFETQLKDAQHTQRWRSDLTPDGKQLAVLSLANLIAQPGDGALLEFIDAHTGRSIRRLELAGLTRADVQSMRFTPDGKFLVTTTFQGPDRLQIWDVETGKLVHKEVGCDRGIVRYSDDGGRSVGEDGLGHVIVYDTLARREILKIDVPNMLVQWPSISEDGKWIGAPCIAAVGEPLPGGGFKPRESEYRIWDIDTGEVVQRITRKEFVSGSWKLSRDGKYILSTIVGNANRAIAGWELEKIVEKPEADQLP